MSTCNIFSKINNFTTIIFPTCSYLFILFNRRWLFTTLNSIFLYIMSIWGRQLLSKSNILVSGKVGMLLSKFTTSTSCYSTTIHQVSLLLFIHIFFLPWLFSAASWLMTGTTPNQYLHIMQISNIIKLIRMVSSVVNNKTVFIQWFLKYMQKKSNKMNLDLWNI